MLNIIPLLVSFFPFPYYLFFPDLIVPTDQEVYCAFYNKGLCKGRVSVDRSVGRSFNLSVRTRKMHKAMTCSVDEC